MFFNLIALTCLESLLILPGANPWISADWGNNEPQYAPGSLFWMTNQYKQCPVVYRTILEVDDKPLDSAVFLMKGLDYGYVFLNGRQLGGKVKKEEEVNPISLDGYIAHGIKPGKNVLSVSTTPNGFSMLVYIKYKDGSISYFSSNSENWKVQKFPPLTMLEFEDFMKLDFEPDGWFSVKETSEELLNVSDSEMENISQRITEEHQRKLDNDAKWRLNMLANKGISIVDWEAYGWGGPERLSDWVKEKAIQALAKENTPGWLHDAAEALTLYVYLEDMATNLKNHVIGLKALGIPDDDIEVFRESSERLDATLIQMKEKILQDSYHEVAALVLKGKEAITKARSKRIVNDFCSCLDNKFGWFDTNALLENDIALWGLEFGSSVKTYSSPLSLGVYISANEDKFILQGWDRLEPIKVYNKPANVGPVCIWAVMENKVKNLKPNSEGLVYDRSRDGELDENWITLIHDLSAGGNLPIELVFISKPEKVLFKTGEKGTNEVIIQFKEPGGRFFVLRPLKEWRGMLQEAQTLKSDPVNENAARQYINEFRLWSRALLNYPITFSEAFIPDPQNKQAILCTDVYNYWELKDDWNTKPLKIAPLPPLATYGLMMQYPGLEVISKTQNLGS
ncbi:hypothetical protein FJZ33_08560, partial [Candidatus Poribacteria bacterium]|nr:hypothetical protein [Candidatus Poribacteria bacterium]